MFGFGRFYKEAFVTEVFILSKVMEYASQNIAISSSKAGFNDLQILCSFHLSSLFDVHSCKHFFFLGFYAVSEIVYGGFTF